MPDQDISQLPETVSITNPDNVLLFSYDLDAPLGVQSQKAKVSLIINKALSTVEGALSIVSNLDGVSLTSQGVAIASIVKFGKGLVFNAITQTVAIDPQVIEQVTLQALANANVAFLPSPKALTVPITPTATYSGSLDPAYSDSWLTANEFNPDGVPTTYNWYSNSAQPGWMNSPPLDWQAISMWGQVYVYGGYSPTGSNTRVQIRNCETWVKSKFTNNWEKLQSKTVPDGAAFASDFGNNGNVDVNTKDEGANGGGLSVTAGNGFNYHFWAGYRGVINPGDISAVYTKFDARLILDKVAGTDDRSAAKYIASAGADYWRSTTSPWVSDWSNNGGVTGGIFKKITNDWRVFSASTIPVNQMLLNPPTLNWLPVIAPVPVNDTTIILSRTYQWRYQPDSNNIQARIVGVSDWNTSQWSAVEMFVSSNRIYITDNHGNYYSCADSDVWSANGSSFAANPLTLAAYTTAKATSTHTLVYSLVIPPMPPIVEDPLVLSNGSYQWQFDPSSNHLQAKTSGSNVYNQFTWTGVELFLSGGFIYLTDTYYSSYRSPISDVFSIEGSSFAANSVNASDYGTAKSLTTKILYPVSN